MVSATEGFDERLKRQNKEERKIEKSCQTESAPSRQAESNLYGARYQHANRVVQQVKNRLPYEGVQGGAVVINHQTHQIVAMSGGKTIKVRL
ncbi:hypothetical protein PO124_19900 [Bacillus licheniformis]|nr:hypothetical protein [Bacillus licheniformis]